MWRFAFVFFVRLWWVNNRLSYPRKGFTPEAISVKKKQLAGWLREELVCLMEVIKVIKVINGSEIR